MFQIDILGEPISVMIILLSLALNFCCVDLSARNLIFRSFMLCNSNITGQVTWVVFIPVMIRRMGIVICYVINELALQMMMMMMIMMMMMKMM